MQVSVACMGTMTFGWDPDDWGSTKEESLRVAQSALEIGINFFDCADVYARGVSETILGEALRGKRDKIVLATKCHGKMADDDPNAWGNSRKHVIEACEASLRRLGTDWIDLYQIHRPQPSVPIDETIRGLEDLIRAGKVRYAGTSTFAAWQLCEAHYVARSLGASGFVCEQPPLQPPRPQNRARIAPVLSNLRLGSDPVVAPSRGAVEREVPGRQSERGEIRLVGPDEPGQRAVYDCVRKLKKIADREGLTLAQLSLAWVAGQPGVTSPIIGAKSEKQLKESADACQIKLSHRALQAIDKVVLPGGNVLNYYSAEFGPNARPWC